MCTYTVLHLLAFSSAQTINSGLKVCEFACRWYLAVRLPPVVLTFDRPLRGQTARAGGGRVVVTGTRAGTGCSVAVSISIHWCCSESARYTMLRLHNCCSQTHPSHMRTSTLNPVHLTQSEPLGHFATAAHESLLSLVSGISLKHVLRQPL